MPPDPDPPGPARPPGDPPEQQGDLEGEVELEQRRKPAHPKRAKVLFHNDDYTTMEYVVFVLRKFFHKTETEALHVMLTVHKKGKAVAGVYPKEVAETKVAEVTRDAREHGHPLLVTAEPE